MFKKRYTVIENWIADNLTPEESDSARQTYDNILLQGNGLLPVINVALDPANPVHAADEALVQQIAFLLKDAREVLDIGTGDGWPSLRIARHLKSVTGVDASRQRIAVARANAERLGIFNVKFQQMSATKLDFSDASFDGVVAATAIEQTPDPLAAVNQVFRVLRPGGVFVVLYESLTSMLKPLQESVILREHPDGSLGWHYCLRHKEPAWERNYLVKFNATPEASAAFEQARATISRVGNNPFEIPEIGVALLETNKASITACTYYELEHFSAQTMRETLADAGFADMVSYYSAGRLARTFWADEKPTDEPRFLRVCQALARLANELPAPMDQDQPIIARKPLK